MNKPMTHQKGFNLIEMLIGLTIGLIGLLAVSQVFVTFNKQRNTATQTMEAQSNGSLALYLVERDLTMAGFGLMNIQDCALIQWYWNPPGCTGANCGLQNPISTQPVVVTAGATADDSDQIQINYAQATSAAPGSLVAQDQLAYGDAYRLASTAGFAVGDMIVADVGGSCTLGKTTDKDDTALTLTHAASNEFNTTTRPGGATGGWEVAPANSLLVNLGSYISKRYRISADSLQLASFPQTGTYSTLVEGILFMKVQYGLDDGSNGGVADDGSVDQWAVSTTAITNTSRLLAMRVGIVARSPLYEKEAVDAPTTLTVLPAITNGAAVDWDVPDEHYRYKAYNTIIPLRNVIWGRAT
jgi:type IV pilus assembly protein PilW